MFFNHRICNWKMTKMALKVMEKDIAETDDIPIYVDKYAVAVKKDEKVIGHLPLGENGKFAKTMFYFLGVDPYVKCHITVVGKAVNLGDGDGMQVPCILHLSGQKSMVEILKQQKMT